MSVLNLISEKMNQFFEQEGLGSFKNIDYFYVAFRQLNKEQRNTLFKFLRESLPSMVKDHEDLCELLKHTSSKLQLLIIKALKEQLPTLISDNAALIKAGNLLRGQSSPFVYLLFALNKSIEAIIKDSEGLSKLMNHLVRDDYCLLLFSDSEIQACLFRLIKDIPDLLFVMEGLNEKRMNILILSLDKRLSQIMTCTLDVYKLLSALSATQVEYILALMQDTFLDLIQNSSDFNYLMSALPKQHAWKLFDRIEPIVSRLIKDSIDFSKVMSCLNSAQKTYIYLLVEKSLPKMISSKEDLIRIFEALPLESCIIFASKIKQDGLFKKNKNAIFKALDTPKSEALDYNLKLWQSQASFFGKIKRSLQCLAPCHTSQAEIKKGNKLLSFNV